MREVKICYSDKANLGDAINQYIVRNVLGYEPVLSDAYTCQITGIGSGLRRFFVDPGGVRTRLGLLLKKMKYVQPVILWSAGFISTPKGNEYVIKKDIKVASVRGELSRQFVEKLLDRPVECTTGDGGLLCSKLIPSDGKKRYKLGIIPHLREKREPEFSRIKSEIDDSIIIDVEDDPIKNLKIISSCESIISSSLHGLIIADSYCVPNKHVLLTNRLAGDGFKFHDYYSAFGLADNPIDLKEKKNLCIQSIIENYPITQGIIANKQEEIIVAFNKYL